ncbi:MAG: cytochrome d ubiquinol oxidase subunit II [Planctomycetaceae bacterium]|nr:cytochrome d ubiquinol oxidase subunit II [Planctomycetaceae bacterium]
MDQVTGAYIWAGLIGLMLALYVVLDGFDLGVGVLSLLTRDRRLRPLMMSNIGAIWDANETWLVVAGGALFGAFPVAYSVALNAFYIPVSVMIFGLAFRAVSFEFGAHSNRKALWERAFGAGSLLAVLGQGFTVGGLLGGVAVADAAFVGGTWDWASGFSALVALAVTMGYVTIGAAYLRMRADEPLAAPVRRWLIGASIGMAVAALAATAAMPFLQQRVRESWIARDTQYLLPGLAIGAAFGFAMLIVTTFFRKRTRWPFYLSLLAFVLTLAGGITVMYPYAIPPSVTVPQAAASRETLVFMLIGIGPLVPVMLLYNAYLYRVFLRPEKSSKFEDRSSKRGAGE